MAFWAMSVYLFVPDKKRVLPLILVSFYLAAGALKFNLEWLSGAALIAVSPVKGPLLTASLFYVVILECFLILGLLVKSVRIRTLTILQLCAFHTISWFFVGYFYPLIMFCLLTITVLTLRNQNSSLLSDFFERKLRRSAYVVLSLFLIAQLIPKVLSKDPSLGGLLRISSETMFDSTSFCYYQFLKYDKNDIQEMKPFDTSRTIRVRCDPIVYLSQLQKICKDDPNGTYDFALYTRKSTDLRYQTVIDIQNICSQKYNLLWAELFQGRH